MKITRTKVEVFEFDIDAERASVKKGFKKSPELRKGILQMLDLFEQGDINELYDTYENLPPCDRDFPGQEYVGWWFQVLFQSENPHYCRKSLGQKPFMFHLETLTLEGDDKQIAKSIKDYEEPYE